MSWDLFHIWNIPTEMAICSNDDIIQLQSIASGDKALIDMISVNPIERIFMYNDEAIVKYRYRFSLFLKLNIYVKKYV